MSDIATSTKLYRIRAVEEQLGVSRSTIYRLVRDGRLVLVKIGPRSSGITAASLASLIQAGHGTH